MGLGRNAKNQRVCGIKTSRDKNLFEKAGGAWLGALYQVWASESGHLVDCRLAAGSMGGSLSAARMNSGWR